MIQDHGYLHFNFPNEEETKIINKFNRRGNKHPLSLERWFNPLTSKIAFFSQGNFIICLMRPVDHQFHTFIGVTKRHPKADEHNEQRARNIALYRAMRNQVIYDPVNT